MERKRNFSNYKLLFAYNAEESVEENKNGIDIINGVSKNPEPSTPSSVDSVQSIGMECLDDLDKFGSTPPRTRLLRRERERRQKEKENYPHLERRKSHRECPFSRRMTVDTIDTNTNGDSVGGSEDMPPRRQEKRSLKLLRGSERDLKLDIGIKGSVIPMKLDLYEDRANSMPTMSSQPSFLQYSGDPIPTLIETCNRFMCLTSSTLAPHSRKINKNDCPIRRPVPDEPPTPVVNAWLNQGVPADRVEFYKRINKVYQMGNTLNKLQRQDSVVVNQDNQVWQNELQELIWLELQAYHADRTPTEQDQYLCQQRKEVEQLLQDLISYKFQPVRDVNSKYYVPSQPSSTSSTATSNDSGFDSGLSNGSRQFPKAAPTGDCNGCFYIYCESCVDHQRKAIKEVESLMAKYEAATGLFPSSRAFGIHYPIINTVEFTSKLHALCLWYNLMRHLRLKIFLMSKFLIHIRMKYYPTLKKTNSDITLDEGHETPEPTVKQGPCVRFDLDALSPTDSDSDRLTDCHESTGNCSVGDPLPDDFWDIAEMEYLEYAPTKTLEDTFLMEREISPFRLFIEDVIKTNGIKGSLSFFESMYNAILRKANITLERPAEGMEFEEYCQNFCKCKDKDGEEEILEDPDNPSALSDECELRRYGYFCPHTQDMNLPSYKSVFLFLSIVPIRILNEFIRMKLERKPAKPSPLSIRQLMREIKEGISYCAIYRKRMTKQLTMLGPADDLDRFYQILDDFDKNFTLCFEVYLEYLEQWSLMIQNESYQKNAIEDEWAWVKTIIPSFPAIKHYVGDKFAAIVGSMLKCIITSLNNRIEELETSIHTGISADEDPQKRHCMWFVFRKLQRILNEERERTMKAVSFAKTLRKDLRSKEYSTDQEIFNKISKILTKLAFEIVGLRKMINSSISRLELICDIPDKTPDLDDAERVNLRYKCFDILQSAFQFGYEIYMQHHTDIMNFRNQMDQDEKPQPSEVKEYISRSIIQFAKIWIQFILKRCEPSVSRGPTKLRWLTYFLEFLTVAGAPQYTKFLTEEEFLEYQTEIESCYKHIAGWKSGPKPAPSPTPGRIRRVRGSSSSSSPQPLSASSNSLSPPVFRGRASLTKVINKENADKFLLSEGEPEDYTESPDSSMKDIKSYFDKKLNLKNPTATMKPPLVNRIRDSVNRLEIQLDEKLRSNELIGQVTATHAIDRVHIKSRVVTFSWQRGIKIGQGRFGKVYTAVNNQTGEMLAMKEISLLPNDHKMIKRVAEEIKTFEGLTHENLVKYYGVEIHREEMIIFMEFCAEGTLENLVAATDGGLPELLIRQYTRQLLSAVALLHSHGVVHRDIKSANIFLTNEGKCVKLGDFGSAVKIKAHTTMPGELQAFVGTQAYMAPEVFMKTNTEGHGRAADIWSIGCVVVEMGSGKRPWAQYDSNYQIMFVVGMGEIPDIPDRLSDEAKDFLDCCLQHNPKDRATTKDLQDHNFAKVDETFLE